MLWVLLFLAIGLGGLAVLALVGLRLWRSARGLLGELDEAASRAGELADLLAQVQVAGPVAPGGRTVTDGGSEVTSDDAWPGTVESYSDQGAHAPGKKEP